METYTIYFIGSLADCHAYISLTNLKLLYL
jgi:hypothetical protein